MMCGRIICDTSLLGLETTRTREMTFYLLRLSVCFRSSPRILTLVKVSSLTLR